MIVSDNKKQQKTQRNVTGYLQSMKKDIKIGPIQEF
jgi:hypothetical protein